MKNLERALEIAREVREESCIPIIYDAIRHTLYTGHPYALSLEVVRVERLNKLEGYEK